MATPTKEKTYVEIKLKVLPGNDAAKRELKAAGVSRRLTVSVTKAAVRGLPKSCTAKDKPKDNKRPYDGVMLGGKVKLTSEPKGAGIKVTAKASFRVGAYKVKSKKEFMGTSEVSATGKADGRPDFERRADEASYAVVEHLTRKVLTSPGMKAFLKGKGVEI